MIEDAKVRQRPATPYRSMGQRLKDFMFAPLRFALADQQALTRLGLTTLSEERFEAAAPYCSGQILDMTCGRNVFKKFLRADMVGMDILMSPAIDLCADAHALPLSSDSFDTAVLLASLNYMSDPALVLSEAFRVLRGNGCIVVSMITPSVGRLRQRVHGPIARSNGSRHEAVTLLGIATGQVEHLMSQAGFTGIERRSFLYGLNHLIIGRKP